MPGSDPGSTAIHPARSWIISLGLQAPSLTVSRGFGRVAFLIGAAVSLQLLGLARVWMLGPNPRNGTPFFVLAYRLVAWPAL